MMAISIIPNFSFAKQNGHTMRFSNEEISIARKLHTLGLPWQPQPGHYVWDEKGIIEQPSPFMEKVYFILDLKHFLRRSETIEGLKGAMFWLPTWEQCRELLRSYQVSDATILDKISQTEVWASTTERLTLYQLLEQCLQK